MIAPGALLVSALARLRPGAAWRLDGDDVSGLIWLDDEQPRPSDGEIAATVAELSTLPSAPRPEEKFAAIGITREDLLALINEG